MAFHEANRKKWNAMSRWWQAQVEKEGVWRKCPRNPSLVLSPGELRLFRGVRGKRVCVLGSGDNKVVFALAGMGARVTSVDISEVQLAIAAGRARCLGLDVGFARADVTRLPKSLPGQPFDFVYTGGHVAVWISDLRRYYSEAARILRKGGRFIVCEYHPFRRIWKEGRGRGKGVMVLERGYFDRRPRRYDAPGEAKERPGSRTSYEFMWTVSDLVGAAMDAGISIDHFSEFGETVEDWEPAVHGLPHMILISGKKPCG